MFLYMSPGRREDFFTSHDNEKVSSLISCIATSRDNESYKFLEENITHRLRMK